MADAAAPGSVDMALLGTWITGWALARETPPPRPVPGGFRVEVGWPDQRARVVFAGTEGVAEAAQTIDEPWVWLKVCAPADAVRPLLRGRWGLDRVGYMMKCATARQPGAALPIGYAIGVEARGAVQVAEVRGPGGEAVASGRVAVVGDAAVFDRIATDAGHRRRGLGRAVMAALGEAAAERGARRGLLVGTAEGRPLYATLGWHQLSDYTSAVIRPPSD